MAASEGYKCEFIDSVREDFYCKKCTLVARRLTIADCCGESFCHTCITATQEQGQPCPECGEKEFAITKHVKNQKMIKSLQVYCSMKERGCVWSGTLDQLDTHLDNCQYVNTKCPLNCLQTIPKNKVDHHVAQECTKRPHVCQHCAFKATYEEVVDTHLPECKYVPLQCPNFCGVSCDREVIEDHMKICRLEEVECEFSSVGCDGRFIREDQDEHTRQNNQKHLTLTASLAVVTKEQLQQKLLDQDKKHKEDEEKLKKKIKAQEKKLGGQEKKLGEQEKKLGEQEKNLGEQEKKLGEQEKKLGEQEKKLGEQEKKLGEQEKNLGEQEKKLGEQEKKLGEQEKKLGEQTKKVKITDKFFSKLERLEHALQDLAIESDKRISVCFKMMELRRTFVMENFSKEKAKDKPNDWKSPAMYTHVGGYKFCIGVDANGCGDGRGKSLYLDIWPLPGEFDDELEWPATAQFTIELINKRGRENVKWNSSNVEWKKPVRCNTSVWFNVILHSSMHPFLQNDELHFVVSNINIADI